MLVQHGVTNIVTGSTDVLVNLTTPVPVGKSWAMCTFLPQTGIPGQSRQSGGVLLDTVVEGYYTQLRILFVSSTSCTWQVISGDEFTVQQGTAEIPGWVDGVETGDDVTVGINAVELSETFVVSHVRWQEATYLTINSCAFEFVDTENIRFFRNGGSNVFQSVARVTYFIVEWAGASVQRGHQSSITTGGANITISAVDLAKSFATGTLYAAGTGAGNSPLSRLMVRLTGTTTLNYVTYSTAAHFTWQVVSHPDIAVQSDYQTATDGTTFDVTLNPVTLSKTFLATQYYGNAALVSGSVDSNTANMYQFQHEFIDTETLRLVRYDVPPTEARRGIQFTAYVVSDTSGGGASLSFTDPPSVTAKTGNSYTLGGTLSEAGHVYAVAVLPTEAAPTSAQIIAGHNAADAAARGEGNAASDGAGAFSVAVTGASLNANPIHRLHAVGRAGSE